MQKQAIYYKLVEDFTKFQEIHESISFSIIGTMKSIG